MFPQPHDEPAGGMKRLVVEAVARKRALELWNPVVGVGCRDGAMVGASVPEAPVEVDGHLAAREDDVRWVGPWGSRMRRDLQPRSDHDRDHRLGPDRRPGADLGRRPPPRRRGARDRHRHRPLPRRLPRRRQVGPLRRRPLGGRPPGRARPGRRPRPVRGTAAAGAVRRWRVPGRRPPPHPGNHPARGRPRPRPRPQRQGGLPRRQVPQQAHLPAPRRRTGP